MTENNPVVQVNNLQTHFFTEDGVLRAVDGVSFSIMPGRTLGLVGESGCGKSATALSLMRMVPEPPGKIVGGEVLLEGEDVLRMSRSRLREIRGNRISMIFQDPFTSLDPVYTAGQQIAEALVAGGMQKREAWKHAVGLLARVHVPDPELAAKRYPHELSGGLRQRVMFAIAFAYKPSLLIADEPTTALDVTVQAQMLQLMKDLQRDSGSSILLVTHDFGVVGAMCDDVAVMYAGRIVEIGPVESLFSTPKHPYTQGLLELAKSDHSKRLAAIPGQPPDVVDPPQGCRFAPRCTHVMDICRKTYPDLKRVGEGHDAACWLESQGPEVRDRGLGN